MLKIVPKRGSSTLPVADPGGEDDLLEADLWLLTGSVCRNGLRTRALNLLLAFAFPGLYGRCRNHNLS
jgi:hypothetical protein